MLHPVPLLNAISSSGGFLLVLSIIIPVAGVLLAFVLGDRCVKFVAYVTILLGSAIVLAILVILPQSKSPIVYLLGTWPPPLGVALRADGLSAVMLGATTVVICAVAAFASGNFSPAVTGRRASFAFWLLLLAVWGALNAICLGGDLFTLYVALELLTFAAVPLVSLEGRAETLWAAMQYLLFALLGSVLYLLGTALLYGMYGTLDIVLLSQRVSAVPPALLALALMTTGLLAKTALFPLHLWLPPAHAGAPSAASAILSGLVVKGSFFIIVRLWFNVMPSLPGFTSTQLLAALGGAAILFGSVVALRQERLKLLIAYSTLAQIGYLFLMFPLAFGTSGSLESGGALTGGMLQAISHATAKAAMFMAAGAIYATLGQDHIIELGGIWRIRPISVLAFTLSGFALMGLPPSGAYLAKELLLQAATEQRQWWWTIVLQAGGIFTGAYIILVLAHTIAPAKKVSTSHNATPRICEMAALALALFSLLLGLVPWEAYLSIPQGITLNKLDLEAFSKALLPLVGGSIVALLLGRSAETVKRLSHWRILLPLRCLALASSDFIGKCNNVLRQWPIACICLLLLTVLFLASMID